jgi:small subunit ribosomal protein S16
VGKTSLTKYYQLNCGNMIKIRLKKFGKKREASYRLVAMQSTSRRDGRPLEELGFYNPRTDEVRLDTEAILKRLQQGAQPTDTVRRILEKANVIEQLGTKSA